MKHTVLYKRNAQGNIIRWSIKTLGERAIALAYGLLNGKETIERYNTEDKPSDKEFDQRVAAKMKSGYKSLASLKDNAPEFIENTMDLKHYLDMYLPKDNTTLA